MKHFLFALLVLTFAWSFVGAVFGNPVPLNPPWVLGFAQIFLIVSAEFCGILAGVAILVRNPQTRWYKSTLTVAIALFISYGIGMVVWTLGYLTGILVYDPINMRSLLFIPQIHPLGLVVLLLPEIIGVAVGTIVIQILQKTGWKTAFIAMTAAMLASFLLSAITAYFYLGNGTPLWF